MKPTVAIYPDAGALSRAAAEACVRLIGDAVSHRGRCSVALSGGNTPRPLYRLLAAEYGARVLWANVHLFWGDERYMPQDDPRSNYRMAKETLLDGLPVPPQNVHPMQTGFSDPDQAAAAYEQELREYFGSGPPRFDLILLGMGVDGHTASLFPGSDALTEPVRWVMPVRAPIEPALRLTLPLHVLNRAAHVYFVVAGTAKADALARVLAGERDPQTCTASHVTPIDGEVIWWTDAAAAALLGPAYRTGEYGVQWRR